MVLDGEANTISSNRLLTDLLISLHNYFDSSRLVLNFCLFIPGSAKKFI